MFLLRFATQINDVIQGYNCVIVLSFPKLQESAEIKQKVIKTTKKKLYELKVTVRNFYFLEKLQTEHIKFFPDTFWKKNLKFHNVSSKY